MSRDDLSKLIALMHVTLKSGVCRPRSHLLFSDVLVAVVVVVCLSFLIFEG